MWLRSLINSRMFSASSAVVRKGQQRAATRRPATCRLSTERLESRETPASMLAYTDVDGDQVKITSSAGTLDNSNVSLVQAGVGRYCDGLTLAAAFAGADITFKVTKSPDGDGLANVGFIDASGFDLGNVT